MPSIGIVTDVLIHGGKVIEGDGIAFSNVVCDIVFGEPYRNLSLRVLYVTLFDSTIPEASMKVASHGWWEPIPYRFV